MAEASGADRQRVSWRWVLGCSVLGAAGVGGGFFVEDRWGWVGMAPASMLQFGSALFVAAVLFFVQRRFLREVRIANRVLEERFEVRTSELESRLDQLTEATTEAVTERHRSQDAVLARLSDEVSFETVTSALEEAKRLNAIDPVLFRVQASARPDGLRVGFGWVEWESSDAPPTREFELRLSSPDPLTAAALSSRRVTWQPGQPAPAVGDAVVLMLEQEGLFMGPETFDWGRTIASLQRSLELAISTRRFDAGAVRLQGRLVELFDDDWMLTDAGIECPARSFLLSHAVFPDRPSFPPSPLDESETPEFEPVTPPWVASELWGELLRRARQIYPIAARSVLQDPGWRWRLITPESVGHRYASAPGTSS